MTQNAAPNRAGLRYCELIQFGQKSVPALVRAQACYTFRLQETSHDARVPHQNLSRPGLLSGRVLCASPSYLAFPIPSPPFLKTFPKRFLPKGPRCPGNCLGVYAFHRRFAAFVYHAAGVGLGQRWLWGASR